MENEAYAQNQLATTQNMVLSNESAREVSEVQAAIIVAQRCPRDEVRAQRDLITACKRRTLAESATYCYPRGGEIVKGPSIRLAEVAARVWGNVQYGWKEVEKDHDKTVFEAYAWDVQTNVRVSRRFSQKHERYSKKKGKQKLTDERDIYELVANAAARRMRACILEIIPGDVIEDALLQCERTKLNGAKEMPMEDRIKIMVQKFQSVSVTIEMLERRLKHPLKEISLEEMGTLADIFTSLKDGISTREDWFKTTEIREEKDPLEELNERTDQAPEKEKKK